MLIIDSFLHPLDGNDGLKTLAFLSADPCRFAVFTVSVHDSAEGNDLQVGLFIRHVAGIVEPDLAAAHADPLAVDKHIQQSLFTHDLPVAVSQSLVLHIADESIAVSQTGAVDHDGIVDHVGHREPVLAEIGGPHVIADDVLDLVFIHGRDHFVVLRVGDFLHVGGRSPAEDRLAVAGGKLLRDGQRIVRKAEDCRTAAVRVADLLFPDAAVAVVDVLRHFRVGKVHRGGLRIEMPAHDRNIMKPGTGRIGHGDPCVFLPIGLDHGLPAVIGAVYPHKIHHGILSVILRGGLSLGLSLCLSLGLYLDRCLCLRCGSLRCGICLCCGCAVSRRAGLSASGQREHQRH